MEVTIFQNKGRVYRFSNVVKIFDDASDNTINLWLEDNSFKMFEKDLIAQIKIGGQHEYKKR